MMVDWNKPDNEPYTMNEIREMEARRTGRRFEREFFMNWPEQRKQCMMRIGWPTWVQCINEAKFVVMRVSGEAQDVCRDCLPVACEKHDEVHVMKLKGS